MSPTITKRSFLLGLGGAAIATVGKFAEVPLVSDQLSLYAHGAITDGNKPELVIQVYAWAKRCIGQPFVETVMFELPYPYDDLECGQTILVNSDEFIIHQLTEIPR